MLRALKESLFLPETANALAVASRRWCWYGPWCWGCCGLCSGAQPAAGVAMGVQAASEEGKSGENMYCCCVDTCIYVSTGNSVLSRLLFE